MPRTPGTFNFSANFEVKIAGMLDARQYVENFSDLLSFVASDFIPLGFPVVVAGVNTPAERGIYLCVNPNDLSNSSSWSKSGIQINDVTPSTDNAFSSQHTTNLLSGKADLVGGKVPSEQLPSFVDDVLDGIYVDPTTFLDPNSTPYVPESGKVYIDVDTNITYRWSGTQYAPIGSDLALGETAQTAYRGDRGKSAYDHSQLTHDKAFVGLGSVDNTSDANKPVSIAQAAAIALKQNRIITPDKMLLSNSSTGELDEIDSEMEYEDNLSDQIFNEDWLDGNILNPILGQKFENAWQIAEKSQTGWDIRLKDPTKPIVLNVDMTNTDYYSGTNLDVSDFIGADILNPVGVSAYTINSISGLKDTSSIKLQSNNLVALTVVNAGSLSNNSIRTSTGANIVLSIGTFKEMVTITKDGSYNVAHSPLIVN